MTSHAITCPGCGRPLNVPPDAVGRKAHCPHCRTNFFLPANPDGTPGLPQIPTRKRLLIPKAVAAPGFALLLVGVLGTLTNGMLLAMFLARPGSDLAYARGQVTANQSIDALLDLKEGKGKLLPPAEPDAEQAARDEELAKAWAPAMIPLHARSLALSLATVAGAGAMLAGRLYPLALLGCVAAALNLNNFCCVPGGIAGGWGVLVLIRDDARRYFRRAELISETQPASPPPAGG